MSDSITAGQEQTLHDALSAAEYILRLNHHRSEGASTIVLDEVSLDMFIRLAERCQRELGHEGELLYGHFEDLAEWEILRVLEPLDEEPFIPEWCHGGPLDPEWGYDEPLLDSKEIFFNAEQEFSGDQKLVFINRYGKDRTKAAIMAQRDEDTKWVVLDSCPKSIAEDEDFDPIEYINGGGC